VVLGLELARRQVPRTIFQEVHMVLDKAKEQMRMDIWVSQVTTMRRMFITRTGGGMEVLDRQV